MDGDSLRRIVRQQAPLVGAAVGSGMTAAAAEEGGADLVMILNAGHFRLLGASSVAALLPYADANRLTWEIAERQVLPRVSRTPVILGVCAQDPALDVERLFGRLRDYGVAGITNFPSAAFYDGRFRDALEATEFGYAREVELLRRARDAGLFTIGFCLAPSDADAMARRDAADILCLNLGIADWRTLDVAAHQAALDRAVESLRAMIAAAARHRPDPYCVTFGGPVVLPQDTAQVYQRTGARGYIGGSSVERFPTASAVTQTVREFRHVIAQGPRMDRLGALIGT
ncbi:MAG TPA: phosphoenolpyruvate hydrolase family protein, partial [Planctomycetota bacterium]|nr:phosphoenolpyruvate hydrolase family protein [Planctomycetota bacterium]